MGPERRDVDRDGGTGRVRRGGLVPPRRPGFRDAHRPDAPDPRGPDADGRSRCRSRTPSASRRGSCRCPTDRSAPRSGSTRDGSISRSTSSIGGRDRRSARSDSPARTGRPRQSSEALAAADVIVIGPSNPIVSIGPILAGPIRDLVTERALAGVPVVAVSPIVGGVASQGPGRSHADVPRPRIRAPGEWPGSTGVSPRPSCSTRSTPTSEPEIAALGMRTLVTDTVMGDHPGRARLAGDVLEFAALAPTRLDPAGTLPDPAGARP